MSSCENCMRDWEEFECIPRVLPCGHSSCEQCISVSMTNSNEFICSECSFHFQYNDLCNVPVNRTLLQLCAKLNGSIKLKANSNSNVFSSICRQLNFNESNVKETATTTTPVLSNDCSNLIDVCTQMNNLQIDSSKQRKMNNWQQSNISTASTAFGSSPNDDQMNCNNYAGFSNPFVTPCKQQLASAFLDSEMNYYRASPNMISEQPHARSRFNYTSQNCSESANKTFQTVFESTNRKGYNNSQPIFVDFD